MDHPELSFSKNCQYGEGVIIMPFTNLYDSELGSDVFIGPFVEIGGAKIGARTKISSHSYICPLVEIGTDCFIAHGVKFCNDDFTSPPTYNNINEVSSGWSPLPTKVGNSVRIGSNCTILPGITIGDHAVIGAGSTVTKDVPAGEIWIGGAAHKIHPKVSQLIPSLGSGVLEQVYCAKDRPELVVKPDGNIFLGAVKLTPEQARDFIESAEEKFFRSVTPLPISSKKPSGSCLVENKMGDFFIRECDGSKKLVSRPQARNIIRWSDMAGTLPEVEEGLTAICLA